MLDNYLEKKESQIIYTREITISLKHKHNTIITGFE